MVCEYFGLVYYFYFVLWWKVLCIIPRLLLTTNNFWQVYYFKKIIRSQNHYNLWLCLVLLYFLWSPYWHPWLKKSVLCSLLLSDPQAISLPNLLPSYNLKIFYHSSQAPFQMDFFCYKIYGIDVYRAFHLNYTHKHTTHTNMNHIFND